MTKKGKCINFGGCEKADAREVITATEAFECPECQKPLQPVGSDGKGGFLAPRYAKMGLVALPIALILGVSWWIFSADSPDPAKADQMLSEFYPHFKK